MFNNGSAMNFLGAFAITFVAGVLSTAAMGLYVRKVKADAVKAATAAA